MPDSHAAWSAVVVDRSAWSTETVDPLLSANEQAELATFHDGRRVRSSVARVLAKRLFLESPGRGWEASLSPDGARDAGVLRALEVLSGGRHYRQTPRLWQAGAPVAGIGISMAHCGDITMVMVGEGRVGVDVERVRSRRAEFYRQMFSAEEQQLVTEMSRNVQKTVEAVFTLLWCAKEAYLKASGRTDIGVWRFGQWTVTPVLSTATTSDWDTPLGVSTLVHVRGPQSEDAGRLLVRRQGDMLSVGLQLPAITPDCESAEEREEREK